MEEDSLKSLVDAFKRFEPDWQIDATCADKNERHLDDLRKIELVANAPINPITHLRLSSRSEDDKCRATLELTRAGGSNCTVSIHGGESKVVTLSRRIDEILSSSAPWYSAIHGTSFVVVQVVTYLVMLGAGVGIPWATGYEYSIRSLLIAILLPLLAFPAAWLLQWSRDRWFPLGVFALNQGKTHHENQEKWRLGVVATFLLSIAASLIVAIALLVFDPPEVNATPDASEAVEQLPIERRTLLEHTELIAVSLEGKTSLERQRVRDRDLGKRFRWTGYVNDISELGDSLLVSIRATRRDGPWFKQNCKFSRDLQFVLSLGVDDKVTVDGVMSELYWLGDCTLGDVVAAASLPPLEGEQADSTALTDDREAIEELPIEPRTLMEHAELVLASYEGKTSLERQRLSDRDVGKRFRWTGYVNDVSELGDSLLVSIRATRRGGPWFNQACKFSRDLQFVLSLGIGDKVTVDGVMSELYWLGNCALGDVVAAASLPPLEDEQADTTAQLGDREAVGELPIEPRTLMEHAELVSASYVGKTSLERQRLGDRDLGKRFRWTGYVYDMWESGDTIVVAIRAARGPGVPVLRQECEFSQPEPRLLELESGDKITVDGVMRGASLRVCRLGEVVPVAALPPLSGDTTQSGSPPPG
ncbi:MAG: hypothetical protein GY715_00545 [Planctomycetes bacterium]|nr:hypothetical protein [Planctomycetota bacterium]